MPFIQDCYLEASQVALIGLEQASDKMVRQYAIENDYVIVTKDTDFYEMTMLYGQPPKVIWLKIGNQSKATTIRALLDSKAAIERALMQENMDYTEFF